MFTTLCPRNQATVQVIVKISPSGQVLLPRQTKTGTGCWSDACHLEWYLFSRDNIHVIICVHRECFTCTIYYMFPNSIPLCISSWQAFLENTFSILSRRAEMCPEGCINISCWGICSRCIMSYPSSFNGCCIEDVSSIEEILI